MKYPTSRKDDLVIQRVKDELLIYDTAENKAYCLNLTAAVVWESSDGTRSISELTEEVSLKTNAKVSEDLIRLALDQLIKEGLLEYGGVLIDFPDGVSRREIIRKISLSAAIGIPIFATLVAPAPAHAQSCAVPFGGTPIGSACTYSCQCAVGNPNMTGASTMGCCGEDRGMASFNGQCRPQRFGIDAGGGCRDDGIGSS